METQKAVNVYDSRFVNLEGRKFGRLIVKELYPWKENGHVFWECVCDCGTFFGWGRPAGGAATKYE